MFKNQWIMGMFLNSIPMGAFLLQKKVLNKSLR